MSQSYCSICNKSKHSIEASAYIIVHIGYIKYRRARESLVHNSSWLGLIMKVKRIKIIFPIHELNDVIMKAVRTVGYNKPTAK